MNEQTIKKINIITFSLGTEIFGIETDYVTNIIDKVEVTPIPKSPDTLKGVINIRGTILPLINTYAILETQSYKNTKSNYIVIETQIGNQNNKFAIEVDSVLDVLEIDQEQIIHPPKLGIKFPDSYLKGIIKNQKSFVLLLNIDQTFNTETLYKKKHFRNQIK